MERKLIWTDYKMSNEEVEKAIDLYLMQIGLYNRDMNTLKFVIENGELVETKVKVLI